MRQFWLLSEDDSNFIIDLQNKDAFAADPDGLGTEVNASGFRAGTDIIYYNEQPTYAPIKFNMIFGAESGEPYESFGNFIARLNGKRLVLAYKPDDGAYDPDENFRPDYLYSDSVSMPSYTDMEVKTTKKATSKTVTKTYSITKDSTYKSKSYAASSLGATSYTTFKVQAWFKFKNAWMGPATFNFTSGTAATRSDTVKKKKTKKTQYKVTIKAVYDGSNKVTYTLQSTNKSVKITSGKYLKVTYSFAGSQTIKTLLPSGDASDMPSTSWQTTVTPSNSVATVTITPGEYTTFSVYAFYTYNSSNQFLASDKNEFIVGEAESQIVYSDGYKFTIAYDGSVTVTITCTQISISSYTVTIQYDDITLSEDFTEDDINLLNEDIYYRKVKFVSASKGEINHDVAWLESELTFAPTTPWFRWEPIPISTTTAGADQSVNVLPVDTTGCVLFSSTIQTVPFRCLYVVKSTSSYFEVRVHYYDKNDPTKLYTSDVKFTKSIQQGNLIEINSDFEDFSAKLSTNKGRTWTDLMPYLDTSGVGFARVKADGVSYIDFKGTSEVFYNSYDQLWFRKEMVIV